MSLKRRSIIIGVCLVALIGVWGMLALHLFHDCRQAIAAVESTAAIPARAVDGHGVSSGHTIGNLLVALLFSCLIVVATRLLLRSEWRSSATRAELSELSRSFVTLLEHTTDFICFKDREGRFIYCSQPMARITGHRHWREMIGKHAREVFPEEMARIYEEEEAAVFANGLPLLNRVDPYFDEQGRRGWVNTNKWPLFDEQGQVNGIFGISRTVTEQHRRELIMQARLRLLEYSFSHTLDDLLRKVLDEAELLTDSRIGFFHFFDEDGNNLHLQAWSTATVTPFCSAEAKGQHYPLEKAGVWADCARERRPVIHNDYPALPNGHGLPDGHVPVRRELTVPLVRDDRVVAVIGVGNKPDNYTDDDVAAVTQLADVTWEIVLARRAQDALQEAKQAAEDANVAKSRFLATMSHELRTPLNGIIGMAAVMLETEPQGERRTRLEIIRSCALSLLEIISDVLEFARLEAHKVELEISPFNLATELHESVEMLRYQAEQRGLTLQYHQHAGLPAMLLGDAGRLRQVIVNLVGNAIKFTTTGKIDLTVQPGEVRDGRVRVDVAVADSGIGMSPEQCATIFEPFVQAGDNTGRTHGGAGLGLSICRDLVRMMGGEISVESVPGKGSTFRFSASFALPEPGAGQAAAAAATAPDDPIPHVSRRCRILVVEDDGTNRIYIQTLLNRLGHHADLAGNGREALDALAREDYDLVLLDCRMPVMDGFEAIALIRDPASAVRNHRVPVLAITANAMKGDREQCLAAGMDAYLSKPFEFSDFARIVNGMLAVAGCDGHAVRQEEACMRTVAFDRDALERRMLHNPELIRTITGMFLDDVPNRLAGIAASLAAGDMSGLALHAHTIKGLAATCGAGCLQESAVAVERAATAGNLEEVQRLVVELERRYRLVGEAMKTMA